MKREHAMLGEKPNRGESGFWCGGARRGELKEGGLAV